MIKFKSIFFVVNWLTLADTGIIEQFLSKSCRLEMSCKALNQSCQSEIKVLLGIIYSC